MATNDPKGLASLSLAASSTVSFTPPPESSNCVTVSALEGGGFDNALGMWMQGVKGNFEMPSLVFKITEEGPSKRGVLFDLGLRKDCTVYGKDFCDHIFEFISGSFWGPDVSVPAQLRQHGVNLTGLESIIFSHTHFDHLGDLDLFPTTVGAVVGPGASATIGGPINMWPEPLESGRQIREIAATEFNLRIGAFDAYDFFGNGSLYLLSTPGHLPGHMSALARTSSSPSEFILLIGDASHHRGLFTCCTHSHPKVSLSEDADGVLSTFEHSLPDMYATMAGVARMEAEANIMVVLSHDPQFTKVVKGHGKMWPETLNGWGAGGWKAEVDEVFLADQAAYLAAK
ncbi:hypothetical protein RQP46_005897 [Phenoliferia psychrophenolica]